MDEKGPAILDTSVLLNFLVIDRLGLLASHPYLRFLVTEHVQAEIADHYPEERQRLEEALQSSLIEETTVTSRDELDLFVALARDARLGLGECSAIAAASKRRIPLAIDDRRARRPSANRTRSRRLAFSTLNSPLTARGFFAGGIRHSGQPPSPRGPLASLATFHPGDPQCLTH